MEKLIDDKIAYILDKLDSRQKQRIYDYATYVYINDRFKETEPTQNETQE